MMTRRGWIWTAAIAAGSAAVAASLGSAAWAAGESTVVQGPVLRIVSALDPAQAATMTEGVPVSWDLEVTAVRADGVIDLSLDATAPDDAFDVTVRACDTAWTDAGCPAGERMLASGAADTAFALARQSAAATGWYRVDVELAREAPGASATLVFGAVGTGADGPAPTSGTLPATGLGSTPLVVPALGAIVLGLCVAGVARHRRSRP
jgi:hypothetical protein